MTTSRRAAAAALFLAYVATIPAANWLVTHFDVQPVGVDLHGNLLMAPAGVYMVGLALVLRDAARELAGRAAVVVAILVGTALSYWLAGPGFATASAAAFALSEGLDFAVYEPLRKRGLIAVILTSLKRLRWERAHDALLKRAPKPQDEYFASALTASNTVGLLADSLLFLWLAFHSLQYLPGQIVGKMWMTVAALVVIFVWRRPGKLRQDGTCTCRAKAACGHCRHDRCEDCDDCSVEGCVCRCEQEAQATAADSKATP